MKKQNKITGKKATAVGFIFNIFSKFATYALLLIFTNLYIPEDYGLASFALNIGYMITLFSLFGTPDSVIPLIVNKKSVGLIFRYILYVNIIIAFIGLVFSFFYWWLLPFIIIIPLFVFDNFATAVWRARTRYDIPFKIGLLSIIVTIAVALLLREQGMFGIVSAYSAGFFVSAIVKGYPIRKDLVKLYKSQSKHLNLKKFLLNGAFIMAIGSIFLIIKWVNSTVLGILGNFESVADYSVAVTIAGAITLIPISLSMFMITRASQIKSKERSVSLLHRITRISFFGSLLAAILLVIFMPLIVNIFFKQYVGIEPYVAIFSLGMIFFSSYYIIYAYHIGKMDSQKILLPVIFGLAINVLAVSALIPFFDVLGVAIGNSFAHLFILLWISRKENMKRIVLMSFVAIALILLVYQIGYFGLIVFALTIPLSLVLKIVTKNDLKVIKDTISGILHVS